jgi:hypothetical protein
VVLAVLTVGVRASATTYEVSPDDDLFGILGSLAAGDEVVVDAGTYSSQQTGGSWYRAVTWSGTASMPIVIRAADGVRPVLEGDPAGSQNLLNIDGSHFVLRGFELVGGSHSLRLGNVDHSVLEDLVIHDIHDVAISCNRPGHLCSALTVRGCEIFGREHPRTDQIRSDHIIVLTGAGRLDEAVELRNPAPAGSRRACSIVVRPARFRHPSEPR